MTPGPWAFSPHRDTHDYIIHREGAVNGPYDQIEEADGVVGSSEWIWIDDDDARLIAAAPELLESLRAVLFGLDELEGRGFEDKDCIYYKARAAIAKATKKEPTP